MLSLKKQTAPARVMYATEQRIIALLGLVIGVMVCFYVYFICMSIVNVVLREELVVAIAEANSTIGELETMYLAKKNEYTEVYASQLGLVRLDEPQYVEVVNPARSLTLNQPERNQN